MFRVNRFVVAVVTGFGVVASSAIAQDAPSWRAEAPKKNDIPEAQVDRPAMDFSIDRDALMGGFAPSDAPVAPSMNASSVSAPELGRKATWRERLAINADEEAEQEQAVIAQVEAEPAPLVDDSPALTPVEAAPKTPPPSDFRLRPIKTVEPDYPREAVLDGVDGWVDIRVTVDASGSVMDTTVLESQPPRVFDRSALRAVNRWRFEPPSRAGIADPQEGVYRITFVLNEP